MHSWGLMFALTVVQSGFVAGPDGAPAGWVKWGPREEISPRMFVDRGSLAIAGNGNAGVHGGWEYPVSGIAAGSWYRFTARYRCTGVPFESLQILPRVDWRGGDGGRAGQTDFVSKTVREDGWNRVTADLQAPAGASSAILQLLLSNAPQGTVWWNEVSFAEIPRPAARPVTVATLNLRPESTHSSAESVRQFVAAVDRVIPGKTDVILLPEGITIIGTGKKFVDVAETIPGPTTERLGELARKRSSYVVAGIYEREGTNIYNTAVLIDRHGELAGKYRKVYLPVNELDGGLTPGSEYPVFRTDFGTVGLMICYDVMYSEPSQALVRQGAEILLLPIWGGDETLAKARAVENRVFLITSGYDHPTYVMDPDGTRIASAVGNGTAAIATIDLSRRYVDRELGEMRARRMRELRVDVKAP